jgi:hypothetical protein
MCGAFYAGANFALLFVRFLPVLALSAAVFDQPTLSAFEESLIERLFEHVAIGTHFSLRSTSRLMYFGYVPPAGSIV